MPRRLPAETSPAELRRQAAALAERHAASDAATAARLRDLHPRFAGVRDADILAAPLTAADAELAIARDYGFATWQQLTAYIEHHDGQDDFLKLACLTYFQTDRPENRARAKAMLATNPSLATRDIWTAACVGDADAVGRHLDAEPAQRDRRGGHFDWEPLLYACYSRLEAPGGSTLAVARLLIERGANPNAYYMWGGQYRFTALTGAFGEGEMGPVNQPEHPHCEALARLLLDAGAHPNDGQALYNTMFTPGSKCLEMLLEAGLANDDRNNWLLEDDGELIEHPQKTLAYQLAWAAGNHHVERAKLLIGHGADVTATTADGRTLYEAAVLSGHPDLAQYLADHGAPTVALDTLKRFAAACMSADTDAAKALLANEPDLVARLQTAEPDLLIDAASANRLDAVSAMLDLGFDPNQGAVTPLHQAAFQGHAGMAELLLAGGANLHARDAHFAATPLQWAVTAGQTDVEAYFAQQEIGLFDCLLCGNLDRATALLDAEPGLLEATIGTQRRGAEPHTEDWQTPLAFAVARKRPAAVALLLARGARIDVGDAEGRNLFAIAEEQSTDEIVDLLAASRASR